MIKMNFKLVLFSFLVMVTLTGCQTNTKVFKTNLSKKSLPNGVQVLSFKDQSLPFFKVVVWAKKGYAYEPNGALGVTALMSDLLIEGSEETSKEKLAEAFSSLGSSFQSSVGADQIVFSAQSLTEDSIDLAGLFSEVLTKPKFDNKSILDLKMKTSDYLKQVVDNPGSLSSVAFSQTVFKGHGYSRLAAGSKNAVASLRKDDVINRYRSVLNPKGLTVAFIGKWEPGAEALILSNLADLESEEIAEADLDRVETSESPKQTVFFHKKDLKQASISFGISSIARDSEDYEALKLGLFVLGGSFKSRLNKELRIKRGLTYGVGAGIDARHDGGVIKISGSVRHDKVKEFVHEAVKIMSKIASEGITVEELKKSKAIIKGQFPRGIETKEKEASQYLGLMAAGVEGEELYGYLAKMTGLSLDQVNDALRKHLRVERLNTVILGNKLNVPASDMRALNVKVKSYKEIKL